MGPLLRPLHGICGYAGSNQDSPLKINSIMRIQPQTKNPDKMFHWGG